MSRSDNFVLLDRPPSLETRRPQLHLPDAIALIVGIVIGAGIFETPSLVAGNLGSARGVVAAWLLGGLVSLLGALCYAELATTYPHVGGNYYYLQRAFGQPLATLFAWARMTVIQTGSIALLAFVFGDYASQLLPLPGYSPAIYAALAVALLTLLNMLGLRHSRRLQVWVTGALLLGLLAVVVIGLALAPAASPAGTVTRWAAAPRTPTAARMTAPASAWTSRWWATCWRSLSICSSR